jgi:murein DD-endopeptidase MepM/ murein hydrolase activator NlpD
MIAEKNLMEALQKNVPHYHPVVQADPARDKIAWLDLSRSNANFTSDIYNDFERFNGFIEEQRKKTGAKYLVGGYREVREMYRRSVLFDSKEEPRSLHLGIDIWGDAGTKIYTPLGGMVHSFKFNDNDGDYGATIILQHQLETFNFYILYGHLALKDIEQLRKGQFLTRGEQFAHFGPLEENGNWPPHLHFQIIVDIGNWEGDYPGVCKLSEAEKYLRNSPDPSVLLNL